MSGTKGVLVDITKCINCESCVVACRLYNGLEKSPIESDSHDEILTAQRWTVVQNRHVKKNGAPIRRFVKRQCFHCLEPACASACFTKAMQKTPEGPVVYNEDICVGCRYCMIACPFGVLKFEWNKPFPRVLKCQMCLSRIAGNQMPACVSVCPTGALTFGDRDDLLREAKKRIAANPGLYVNHIYGEKEAGGTSWLYISDVPFDQLGFNTNVPEKPIPEYTWAASKWTQFIFFGWGALLTFMYWYTKRRSGNHDAENMYEPVDND